MALSKREKYIAMGVGAVVALLVLDQLVLSPYFDALSSIRKDTEAAVAKQTENATTFEKQGRLRKVWADIQQTGKAEGLKDDESAAESQALNKTLDWAQAAGVNITAVKPERTIVANQFEVISFHVTGTGSTPAVGRLLKSVETASIPVRVDEMTLTPRKEGTDDLKIELTLSTLCSKPPADSADKTNVSYLSSPAGLRRGPRSSQYQEVQPWTE